MLEIYGKFYADWRDKKGVRHRKAFTTPEAAHLFTEANRARRPGKTQGRTVQPSRLWSHDTASRLALITAGLHELSSACAELYSLVNSPPAPSAPSTGESNPRGGPAPPKWAAAADADANSGPATRPRPARDTA
jgi:hypothetical protein